MHRKFKLMRQFIENFRRRNSRVFKYIVGKFPKIAQIKFKESVFVGHQIGQVLKDVSFKTILNELELPVWNAFYWLYQNFMGNKEVMDYNDGIKNPLKCYSAMRCCMSLKVQFLDSHLDLSSRKPWISIRWTWHMI